ncbi:MAG: phosphomannose isomerase type II C-terminal cupin domain [Candidatus Riesia sp.]|nr:phosphomannose isomerase type II C-terminal cupin domain [Candidatus Riesia sp.]
MQETTSSNMEITVSKPWGQYTVLHRAPGYLVKEIIVNEGHRLSLQSHLHRWEIWNILECDIAYLTTSQWIADASGGRHHLDCLDYTMLLPNTTHRIQPTQIHRVEAIKGTLKFIEVQIGETLDEKDITRYQDDYKR